MTSAKQSQLYSQNNLEWIGYQVDIGKDSPFVVRLKFWRGYRGVNEAQENSKSNDACKEYKTAVDGGLANDSIPDIMMAKLIKSWLLFQKQEQLEIRNGGKAKEQLNDPSAEADKKKPTDKDPKANAQAASNAKKPAAKGNHNS
jgi:hypothetical protein